MLVLVLLVWYGEAKEGSQGMRTTLSRDGKQCPEAARGYGAAVGLMVLCA